MIKIFLTVRNRLAMTKKCIEAIKRHTTTPFQLYVYDNNSNYLVKEHFEYWQKLYESKVLTQLTITTEASTFSAFSKATASNMFGQQHEQDPNKDSYDFILMLDNDIILLPKWDELVKQAWKHVNKAKLNNIKVITQSPGGVKDIKQKIELGKELSGNIGKLGGSGLWCIRPNFFKEVGFLNLKDLVGHDKRHDQLYWHLMEKSTQGKPYSMALTRKLGIHCGPLAGSVCNQLTRNKINKEEHIKFEECEKNLDIENFDDFFQRIIKDEKLVRGW
jgi:hypothetical protein